MGPLNEETVEKIKKHLLTEDSDQKYTIAKDDKEMDFHITFLKNCKILLAQDTENQLTNDILAENTFNMTKDELGYSVETDSPSEYFKTKFRKLLHAALDVK